jgi:hypothetical protein
MIAVINDIDRLLQSAPSRFGEAYAPELRLSASDPAFLVALDATVSPSEIVFIASRVGLAEGPVTFSTDTGVPLAVDGDVARLVPAAMVGPACTVTVTQTWQGQQYTARATVLKTLAFDASTPPAPGGLRTSGTLVSIQLSWDPTNNTNIGKVEVWRSLVNDLGEAVPVGETAGLARSFSDSIGAAGEFYYWIRYISKANIPGPFNSEGGTHGATGTDAGDLLELLKDRITESQLYDTLRGRIDLVDAEGTGLVDRVDALVEIYGDTTSSAASAVAAAQAAADAIEARAQAILAAGASENAAFDASSSEIAAAASNQAAGTSASSASSSAQSAASYAESAGAAASSSSQAKLAAEAARGDAVAAASAAVSARDTAVARANDAGQYATSASESANTASTKAGEASSAATRAATSESNASSSASSASTSASNAANAANQVGDSARAAAGSASSAATYADNAGSSASAANAAKVAAESARDAAAQSASAASTSASTASTAAGSAGSYASSASQSANTADTAAGAALAYRNSAAQSAIDAAGHASAAAQDVSAVNARLDNVGGTGVTVEQTLSAQADSLGDLRGLAAFVIDNNGYVVGMGIASEIIDGKPASRFIVNAADFAFVTPGAAPQVMFSGGQVNGQTVIGFTGTLMGPSGTLGTLKLLGSLGVQASGYNNDVGIWQGISGGVPKFSIVSPNGAKLLFDPTQAQPLQLVNVPQATSFSAVVTANDGSYYHTAGRNVNPAYIGNFTANTAHGVGPYTYSWSVSTANGVARGWIYGDASSQQAMLAVYGAGLRSEDGSPFEVDFEVQCVVRDTGGNVVVTVSALTTVGFT